MQTIFLPVVGLVDPDSLKPGDLVGVNKDSYLILDTLPSEYDSRVKAMEVDEKPTEDYNDIGGLEKQVSFIPLCLLAYLTLLLRVCVLNLIEFISEPDPRACRGNCSPYDPQGAF